MTRARIVQHSYLDRIAPACRLGCVYCFASEPSYCTTSSESQDIADSSYHSDSPDVLMLGGDTELFANPNTGIDIVRHASQQRCHITFATKMVLSVRVLDELQSIQDTMAQYAKVLCIMVSFTTMLNAHILEPRVQEPVARIAFLEELANRNLHAFVGIRPILPPQFVTDFDLRRIVDLTGPHSHGFITGPYWFDKDVLKIGQMGSNVILRRPVHWLPGTPIWSVYEDPARESDLIQYIRHSGYRHYERSSEAVREIAHEVYSR